MGRAADRATEALADRFARQPPAALSIAGTWRARARPARAHHRHRRVTLEWVLFLARTPVYMVCR